jgi:zinc protease
VTTVEPPQRGERRFRLRKPGDTRLVLAAWRNPALLHPDSLTLDVLGLILGHGRMSRLHQRLVEGGLATEADASNETARDPFLFLAVAEVAPDRTLPEVEAAMLEETERLRREPVTEAELRRAKKQVEAGFLYAKDSIQNLSQQYGYYETVASWRYAEEYPERVRAVTAEDMLRVAGAYLIEDARTVGWYEPPPSDGAPGAGS